MTAKSQLLSNDASSAVKAEAPAGSASGSMVATMASSEPPAASNAEQSVAPKGETAAAAAPLATVREHFIPLRQSDLVDALCKDLSEADAGQLRRVDELMSATFHFQFHRQLQGLKDDYAAFDPDADTKRKQTIPESQKEARLDSLVGRFAWVLERANFRRLSKSDIEAAMQQASYWGVNLRVDFSIFDRLEVYYRGEAIKTRRTPRRWFGVRRGLLVQVPIYRRLVVMLRIKPGSGVPGEVDTDSVHLKVFKDIPKLDLEMLLPGTTVSMSLWDRMKLGFSFSTGIGMTGYKLAAPLLGLISGVTSTTALLGIAGGAVGYSVRSFYGYMQTKQKYMLTLAQSLYFLNLDNNAGVFFRLLDEAEEQESREAMLCYHLLRRRAGDDGLTPQELDQMAERWLTEQTGQDIDFEADDALRKLQRLRLLRPGKPGRIRTVPEQQALEILDKAWDSVFEYNQPAA